MKARPLPLPCQILPTLTWTWTISPLREISLATSIQSSSTTGLFKSYQISHDLAPASWEPEVSAVGEPGFQADDGLAGGPSIPSAPEHNVIEQTAKRRTHDIHFPSTGAGAPLLAGSVPEAAAMTSMHSAYGVSVDVAQTGNPYTPFASRLDWEIARWAKLRGSGSMAFTELLQIEEVCHCIYLSHHLCRSA